MRIGKRGGDLNEHMGWEEEIEMRIVKKQELEVSWEKKEKEWRHERKGEEKMEEK